MTPSITPPHFFTTTSIATIGAHSTPDPDLVPDSDPTPTTPVTVPVPDDVPAPANAPVREPGMPEQPLRAANMH